MRYYISVFISLLTIISIGQTESNKDEATLLSSISEWSSDKNAYSTATLNFDQPIGNCYDKSFTYGKWFKFQATSNNFESKVKIGNGDGTMQQPFLYLFDESLNILECREPMDDTTNISIISTGLTVGKWYYLSV